MYLHHRQIRLEGGSFTAHGATATPHAQSPQTWQAQEKSTSAGQLLTNLSASPSITVFGTATKLVLTAATTTPNAGAADNLTITAEDASGDVVTSYTGSKNLTFAGASSASAENAPTVVNSTGTATAFGSATSITFTNGVAQVSSGENGVMTLYTAGTDNITVTDGSINNSAAPLSVTVAALTASHIAWNTFSSVARGCHTRRDNLRPGIHKLLRCRLRVHIQAEPYRCLWQPRQ